jgi:hypothetical protein
MWAWRARERIPSARRSSLTCHPVALKGRSVALIEILSRRGDLRSPRR